MCEFDKQLTKFYNFNYDFSDFQKIYFFPCFNNKNNKYGLCIDIKFVDIIYLPIYLNLKN